MTDIRVKPIVEISLVSYTPISKNVVGENCRLTDDGCSLYDRKGQWVIVFL